MFHSDAAASDLHDPKGVDPTPLILPTSSAAYVIEDTTGRNYFVIDTSNTRLDVGNATNNPKLRWLGTGAWSFNASDGTFGQVLISQGSSLAPAWSSAPTITGTLHESFTINSDATAASAQNPYLELLGGDGVASPNNDIVRARWTLDSVNELVLFTLERNRNAGGYAAITSGFVVDHSGSGDAMVVLHAGNEHYAIGIDNSQAGDPLVIYEGSALAADGGMRLWIEPNAGPIHLRSHAQATGGAFESLRFQSWDKTQTTTATATTIGTIPLDGKDTGTLLIFVEATRRASDDVRSWILAATIYRDSVPNAATTASTPTVVHDKGTAGSAGWALTIDGNTGDIRIRATGVGGETIEWTPHAMFSKQNY